RRLTMALSVRWRWMLRRLVVEGVRKLRKRTGAPSLTRDRFWAEMREGQREAASRQAAPVADGSRRWNAGSAQHEAAVGQRDRARPFTSARLRQHEPSTSQRAGPVLPAVRRGGEQGSPASIL